MNVGRIQPTMTADQREEQQRTAARQRREPDRDDGAAHGSEELCSEQAVRRPRVHPRRDESCPIVLALQTAEPGAEPPAGRRDEVVDALAYIEVVALAAAGRERACEPVVADLLDRLGRGPARRGERTEHHRHGDGEEEEPEDEDEMECHQSSIVMMRRMT